MARSSCCSLLWLAVVPVSLAAQAAPVPIIELPAATARAAAPFGAVLTVREVSGGRLLVNDPVHHQIVLLDSALKVIKVPIDSVPGLSTSYGARPLPLVRYLGDTSITSDVEAGTLLLLGPSGEILRAVASPYTEPPPRSANLTMMMRDRYVGVDDRARILFNGYPPLIRPGLTIDERVKALGTDSTPIVRASLESRGVDTIAFMKTGGTTALLGRVGDGPLKFSRMPVETIDVWGVLADGALGVVRGHDYHIDWFFPDGSRKASPKLPFDFKRISDEEKQKLIDSVKKVAEESMGRAMAPRPQLSRPDDAGPPTAGARVQAPPANPNGPRMPTLYVPPALSDIPDFYPPLRTSAAIADLDGNLWILPTSTARSLHGELVYDVVNPKGDFHRVRLPEGRSIGGFGRGGVVFLLAGDRANGFFLERTRLTH